MAAAIQWEATATSAGAARRLRVLVLDEALPYPPDSGKRLRTWHLLRRLAARHEVTLLCYSECGEEQSAEALAAMASAGITCLLVPAPPARAGLGLYARLLANCFSAWPYSVSKHHSPRLRRALRELCAGGRFDLIQVEWTPYASHLEAGAPPHLIASHNIEADIWRRRAAVAAHPAARLFFHWQAAKMRRFEAGAFRRARAVTTVSAMDRRQALTLGARRAAVVANGIDLEHLQPVPAAAAEPDRVLFLGSLDWFPNQDGIAYFLSAIWPGLRALRPQARLQIVGRRPPAALRQQVAGQPGVELVGEVADVRPWLSAAAVVVVPLRIGGGSRIKILEALAMEKAVVSTTVGAEGLEVAAGVQLLLADAPAQFAAQTAALLSSPDRAAALGAAGGRWVREHHSWDRCALALESAWRAAAGPSGPAEERP